MSASLVGSEMCIRDSMRIARTAICNSRSHHPARCDPADHDHISVSSSPADSACLALPSGLP
eukprot:4716291-Alexandrium_andersonii.AAC.1